MAWSLLRNRHDFQQKRARASGVERDLLRVLTERLEILGFVPRAVLCVSDGDGSVVARRESLDLVSALLIGAHGAHEPRSLGPFLGSLGKDDDGAVGERDAFFIRQLAVQAGDTVSQPDLDARKLFAAA